MLTNSIKQLESIASDFGQWNVILLTSFIGWIRLKIVCAYATESTLTSDVSYSSVTDLRKTTEMGRIIKLLGE